MSEPFDPYRKWLGIPPKDQPPHHYRLLGIAAFEEDPDVIENAASRQMAHLRTFSTSRHAAYAQRLLTEISAARLCLLTADRKSAYDEQLRTELAAAGKLSGSQILPPPVEEAAEELEAETPAPRVASRWREDGLIEPATSGPPPVPIPMPPPAVAAAPVLGGSRFAAPVGPAVGVPVGVPVIRRSSSASAIRARRNRSALPMLIIFLSLLVLAGAGGIALVVANRPTETAPHRLNSTAHGNPTAVARDKDVALRSTGSPGAAPTPKKHATDFPIGSPAEPAPSEPPPAPPLP